MSADPVPRGGPIEALQFPVSGMTCGSCVNRITRAVKRLEGVSGVHVDLGRELVTVRRQPALVSDAALAAAVGDAGYQADLGAAVIVPTGEKRNLLVRLLWRSR